MSVQARRLEAPLEEPKPKQRRTRRQGLSVEEMHRRWPILKALAGPPGTPEGHKAWEAAFTARPDVMQDILRDLIKLTYAAPGRVGQRPMPREEEVDLDGLLPLVLNERPLVEVLPELIPGSERSFCLRISMSRSTFKRLLSGQYIPTVVELRQIAEAVGKPPTFFVEYRKLMAVEAFMKMITERPGVADKLYREYLEVRAG